VDQKKTVFILRRTFTVLCPRFVIHRRPDDKAGAGIGYALPVTVRPLFSLAHALVQRAFSSVGFIAVRSGLVWAKPATNCHAERRSLRAFIPDQCHADIAKSHDPRQGL